MVYIDIICTYRLLQETQKLAHEMSMSPLTGGYTGKILAHVYFENNKLQHVVEFL